MILSMPGASKEGAGEGPNTSGLAAQDKQEGQGAQTNKSTPAPPVIDPACQESTKV
jgi:hypothetical protein